jgi:hypothetical protein
MGAKIRIIKIYYDYSAKINSKQGVSYEADASTRIFEERI